MNAEPEHYVIGHIQQALATDPRAGELGVRVQIAAGKVLLTGVVPSEAVRAAVGVVAAEQAGDYEIHNATSVGVKTDGEGVETLA